MSPDFLIFEQDNWLPASEIPTLLGRFVLRPKDIKYDFAPDDPNTYLTSPRDFEDPVVKIGDENIQEFNSAEFQASLKSVVSLGANNDASGELTVENCTFTIRSLRHPREAFEKMKANPEANAAVNKLIGPDKKPIFMVAGIKSLITGVGGRINQSTQGKSGANFDITAPVAELVHSAVGVPLPSSIDPRVEGHSTHGSAESQSVRTVGELVYAVQFYNVLTKKGQADDLGAKVEEERHCDICRMLCWCCFRPMAAAPPAFQVDGGAGYGGEPGPQGEMALDTTAGFGDLIFSDDPEPLLSALREQEGAASIVVDKKTNQSYIVSKATDTAAGSSGK